MIFRIVLLILILYILFILTSNVIYPDNINSNLIERKLNGYWSSNIDFSTISEMDDMILYIDCNSHIGMIIIVINDEIECKEEIVFNITNSKKNRISKEGCHIFNIEFISDKDDFIWSDIIFDAHLNPYDGSLKLYNKKILYADLFKDNKISYEMNN